MRELLASAHGPAGRIATIADLGCGTGTLTQLLAREGHQVTGIDFSPEMLRIARAKVARMVPGPTFVEADVQDPPLPPGSLDGRRIDGDRVSRTRRTIGGHTEVRTLEDPALWGGPIADERYALVSRVG